VEKSGILTEEEFWITEEEYERYLSDQPSLHNEVARQDPDKSIFDAMEEVEEEFDRSDRDGKSYNDVFRELLGI